MLRNFMNKLLRLKINISKSMIKEIKKTPIEQETHLTIIFNQELIFMLIKTVNFRVFQKKIYPHHSSHPPHGIN